MPPKLTTERWIEKSMDKWGDEYDYSKSRYFGSNDPVIITCKKHGDFTLSNAGEHISRKSGCSVCAGKKRVSEELSQERLIELIDYNPGTGIVTRKSSGNILGTKNGHGLNVTLENKTRLLHRVIWLYMTGVNPEIIDHINGNPQDNRWENLRDVTSEENSRNMKPRYNAREDTNIFQQHGENYSVKIAGTTVGTFSSKEEAISARDNYYKKHGFTDNHGKQQPKG